MAFIEYSPSQIVPGHLYQQFSYETANLMPRFLCRPTTMAVDGENDCGGCGFTCVLPHATSSCEAGAAP
jgi:hypothetical protein